MQLVRWEASQLAQTKALSSIFYNKDSSKLISNELIRTLNIISRWKKIVKTELTDQNNIFRRLAKRVKKSYADNNSRLCSITRKNCHCGRGSFHTSRRARNQLRVIKMKFHFSTYSKSKIRDLSCNFRLVIYLLKSFVWILTWI